MREADYLLKAWNGIASGELKHKQDTFICGTARCLAGWTVNLEFLDKGLWFDGVVDADRFSRLMRSVMNTGCPWDYCEKIYVLSEDAACTLFRSGASLSEQYGVMKSLYGDNAIAPVER